MSSSDLIRWGGLAAIWGGVLWALWNAGLEFVVGWGEPPSPAYARYEAYNRVMPVILPLLVAGLLGFHAAQKGGHGWLRRAGLIIALIGFTLLLVGNVAEFWVFNTQPYGEANGRDNSWTLYLLGVFTLSIGSVLLASPPCVQRSCRIGQRCYSPSAARRLWSPFSECCCSVRDGPGWDMRFGRKGVDHSNGPRV